MTSRPCPWYVSAAAVRAWQAIDRSAPRDFDAASDALIELCADVYQQLVDVVHRSTSAESRGR